VFVDASAIVAIVTLERGHEGLARRLDESVKARTSPLSIFEAVLAVGRDRKIGLPRARTLVERFIERSRIEVLAVEPEVASLALDAHEQYGKGRGHPARLNFGDCFAYAMAKRYGVPLLYKGDDFAQTDLA
jgi:ribonuclease VapC